MVKVQETLFQSSTGEAVLLGFFGNDGALLQTKLLSMLYFMSKNWIDPLQLKF